MTAVSKDEAARFTPGSLKDVAVPPSFVLRPVTGRKHQAYNHALLSAGLIYHDMDAIRAEMINGLKNLWSPEIFEQEEVRLRAYWDAVDQHAKVMAEWRGAGAHGDAPKLAVSDTEATAVEDLIRRLSRSWRPLAVIAADNLRFGNDATKVAAALVLGGWSGIDVPFRREEGLVPLETIDAVEETLASIERQAAADNIASVGAPGTAFLELVARCARELDLTKDEEKNSPSPSPAPSTPNGSPTMSSSETVDASSQASASSEATQPA